MTAPEAAPGRRRPTAPGQAVTVGNLRIGGSIVSGTVTTSVHLVSSCTVGIASGQVGIGADPLRGGCTAARAIPPPSGQR
jgi:hypothetical protein